MVNVGIAGIGFMGMVHYLNYQKVPGAKVIALCEQDEKRLRGDWTEIKGNFGPAGTMMDLSGIATYTELDEMMANDEIDIIDVCLPPGLHADVAVRALKAGKHVFCEKPMSLTTEGCDRMVAAAEAADKMLMIGHVLPFLPEYRFAFETITSGKYGKLLGGYFKRVISDPLWLPNFYDPDRVGGPMLDLHVHDAHFIRLLFGMPTQVNSQGRMRGDVVEYFNSQYQFEDPALVVSATSGVINQQGRSFTHAFEIHLEKATLLYDLAVVEDEAQLLMPLTVLTTDGEKSSVQRPDLGDGDPMMSSFEAELNAVVTAVESGTPSPILGGNLARDAILLCDRQTEAVKALSFSATLSD